MTATLVKPSALQAPICHHLDNGLTIIAAQMPVDSFNLNIWLKVGSAQETDENNGIAHFLEHMVFKGTSQLQSGDFERLVEGRGALTNAATSQEYTHYYVTGSPDNLALLAPLQLDIVFNAAIPDLAFEREKSVILEEIRRFEDSPRRRTFLKAMQTCFHRLPYRRPVLGTEAIISALPVQEMRDFHRQWYQPAQTTVVIVGQQDPAQLITTVCTSLENVLSDQINKALPAIGDTLGHFSPEPTFTEVIRHEYVEVTWQQARLVMLWKVPGLQDGDKTYALDVLAAILGQGKLSRLFRELREERALVTQISVSNMAQRIQGAFYVAAQLPVGYQEQVEKAILEHIERIQQESVTAKELARVKTQVANRFIFGSERPSDRANLYGYYYSQLGDIQGALTYPERIQALTLEDIQKAAQDYLNTSAYGINYGYPPH
jgi:predicted Zn-dependent peptidase